VPFSLPEYIRDRLFNLPYTATVLQMAISHVPCKLFSTYSKQALKHRRGRDLANFSLTGQQNIISTFPTCSHLEAAAPLLGLM